MEHPRIPQPDRNINNELEDTYQENDNLMEKLHYTQEKLEQAFSKIHATELLLRSKENYIERFSKRVPGYWDVSLIEVLDLKDKTDGARIIVKDAVLNDEIINQIDVEISISGEILNLVIKRTEQPWLNWFNQHPEESMLDLTPNIGGVYIGNNAALSSIGATDWSKLATFISKLSSHLTIASTESYPAIKSRAATLKALNNYSHTLSTWPLIPRYDSVNLNDTFQQGCYKSLGITFTNLQIGSLHWDRFDYRVSTLDESQETFGTNPRIEIPISMKEKLQNWFPESDDERGMRLELRFAKPSAMDIRVWNALAENDKVLMAALISSLPTQLLQISRQSQTIKIEWNEWLMLAQTIKQIIVTKTATMKGPA